MNNPEIDAAKSGQAQRRYARYLSLATHFGLSLLVLVFVAYALGWLAPFVPVGDLPALWGHSAGAYQIQTGMPPGWGWLPLFAKGDLASLAGIAIIVAAVLPGLVAIIPEYLRNRDWAMLCFVLGQVCVILLSASGILVARH